MHARSGFFFLHPLKKKKNQVGKRIGKGPIFSIRVGLMAEPMILKIIHNYNYINKI